MSSYRREHAREDTGARGRRHRQRKYGHGDAQTAAAVGAAVGTLVTTYRWAVFNTCGQSTPSSYAGNRADLR